MDLSPVQRTERGEGKHTGIHWHSSTLDQIRWIHKLENQKDKNRIHKEWWEVLVFWIVSLYRIGLSLGLIISPTQGWGLVVIWIIGTYIMSSISERIILSTNLSHGPTVIIRNNDSLGLFLYSKERKDREEMLNTHRSYWYPHSRFGVQDVVKVKRNERCWTRESWEEKKGWKEGNLPEDAGKVEARDWVHAWRRRHRLAIIGDGPFTTLHSESIDLYSWTPPILCLSRLRLHVCLSLRLHEICLTKIAHLRTASLPELDEVDDASWDIPPCEHIIHFLFPLVDFGDRWTIKLKEGLVSIRAVILVWLCNLLVCLFFHSFPSTRTHDKNFMETELSILGPSSLFDQDPSVRSPHSRYFFWSHKAPSSPLETENK